METVGEHKIPPSLADLEARLREIRARGGPGSSEEEKREPDGLPRNVLGLAFRIGTELVAALIVGIGGGWLIDRWLGTQPWGLIVMFFLGAGGGVANVYRTVGGLGYGVGYRPAGSSTEGESQDGTGSGRSGGK